MANGFDLYYLKIISCIFIYIRMKNILKDINDLNLFKKTGLIEIAKYNSLFHGYWEKDKKQF